MCHASTSEFKDHCFLLPESTKHYFYISDVISIIPSVLFYNLIPRYIESENLFIVVIIEVKKFKFKLLILIQY